ncbi:MAG: hypothetical protein JST00_11700 [Deltaproteobacteria bacterium]|nr:hypothetical protein [Deltaproteobacteria bacterium]
MTPLARALALRDLTDPSEGRSVHVVSLLTTSIAGALGARIVRGPRVVTIADNYDRLGFSPESVTRDARYTRYVDRDHVLRTHTSALVPEALRALARDDAWSEVTLALPGVVYRRDCIDRLHTGEPHQIDLWRVRRAGPRLGTPDLDAMIDAVVDAVLPGSTRRALAAVHPYTEQGRQIDVARGGDWIEIGECGLAHPSVLRGAGLGEEASGLAMGLGLDRLAMLVKGIDDIRLLRSTDPRVADQMGDLLPYRSVSSMPPVRRDLSIAVRHEVTPEELGDRVRAALGERALAVEEIAVLSETPGEDLPLVARERLGLGEGMKNVLVRVVLRDLSRTLTNAEANDLRNAIYAAIHEGSVYAWAG